MRFSICVMADIEEIGFFSHAETLGYDSVWVTDSQMLFSDCYAVLALAAQQTRRIRLGPGVAICGTRIPPVHVAAMATLNRLAPTCRQRLSSTRRRRLSTPRHRRLSPARRGRLSTPGRRRLDAFVRFR